MAFDTSACVVDQTTGLPACTIDATDLLILRANIQAVVAYMADHHIPRDQWDAPYVYRDYLPDKISANDVAALSRIAAALAVRGIDPPPVLAALYSGQDAAVTDTDVYYVAENARVIAELLGPVLSAMREADEGARAFPWGWIAVVAAGSLLLGIALTAPARKRAERGEK